MSFHHSSRQRRRSHVLPVHTPLSGHETALSIIHQAEQWQDDLKPLEIGLHLPKAVPKGKPGRGDKNGLADYARQMGKTRELLQQQVYAASVALKSGSPLPDLLRYAQALSIIHRAGNSDWPALVAAMLMGEWTKETTEERVKAVNAFELQNSQPVWEFNRLHDRASFWDLRAIAYLLTIATKRQRTKSRRALLAP